MKSVLGIVGAGVLGLHIAHYAKLTSRFSKVVFFDDTLPIGSKNKFGKVVGKISEINEFIKADQMQNMLIGVGYKHMDTRKELYEKFGSLIYFPNIIHKSCYFDRSTLTGNGNVILPGCIIDRGSIIGNNIFFNPGCIIAHDNTIKDHTFFGPGVKTSGFVSIGSCCFLGTGTNMVDNITIGNYVNTGAGTLITTNIDEPGVYKGVPGRRT